MTLGRLVLAWLPVSAWFLAVESAVGRRDASDNRGWRSIATLAEAGVLTLFASLWFDSLGSGGWWLLFLLVGVLAGFPIRLRGILLYHLPRRPELVRAWIDVARYVGAGALLAWRLGGG